LILVFPKQRRVIRWDHVDLDGDPGAVRPVLPQTAIQALGEHRRRQVEDRLAAGALWQEHGLVFVSSIGTPLDASNVRREFRKITEAAGLGAGWAPRDLRHTFVSLMSADGVPIEEIACLAGHNQTATTELVYRHELRPVITTGAEVMDRILSLGHP
jgi:integrase